MERLTRWNGKMFVLPTMGKGAAREIAERLAAYENTGLEPGEIIPRKEGEWLWSGGIINCSGCGFGYFPSDYFFNGSECISSSTDDFFFDFCPKCGIPMKKPSK